MFVLCPHCEFLVGVDPRTGQPPATCPKCGQALDVATQDEPQSIEIAPPPAPVPVEAPTPPPPAQLSADDVIAAMTARSPRKSRTRSRADTSEATKPAAAREPVQRKRADRSEQKRTAVATPAAEAAPTPTTPAAPRRSVGQRIAGWFKRRTPRPKPVPKPVPPPAEAPAPATTPARPKASVRPIPSLRERAAKRAAAAVHASETIATPPPAMSEIEALAISDMPLEPVTADTAPYVAAPPVAEVAVLETTIIATAAVETPAPVAEAPSIETPPAIQAPSPALARPRPATAPSFLRVRATPAGTLAARWQRIGAFGGLSLLLGLQLLLAQRDVLAADARWRPTIGAVCGVLRCTVPAWRQPDAFVMLSREVRPHARAPGTLQIDASFRNDARWPQPWPRLVLSLSDIDGRVVGTRAFAAREYLGAAPTQNMLASGQTAAVHLAVVEPAPGIVAFSFEFR